MFFDVFEQPTLVEGEHVHALRIHACGMLRLSSGAIVAQDPLGGGPREPFARHVPPGDYPVELLLAECRGDTRVAFARILFAPGRPSRFELATLPGQDARSLARAELFGYCVDAGAGCFADPDAIARLDSRDLLAALDASAQTTWCVAEWPGGVAFSSGGGDGVYASWWGMEGDRAICLVTDFGFGDLSRPELEEDQAFRRAHARDVAAELLEATAVLEAGYDQAAWSKAVTAAVELGAMGDAAADLAPMLFAALAQTASAEASSPLRTALGRVVMRDDAQLAFAAWLARAPAEVAEAVLSNVQGFGAACEELARALHAFYIRAGSECRAGMLGKLGGADKSDELASLAVAGLSDPSGVVRAAALAALRSFHRPPGAALPELRRLGREGDASTRAATAAPLVASGLLDDARALLEDPSPAVRLAAARRLYPGKPELDDRAEAIALETGADEDVRVDAACAVRDDGRRLALLERLASAGSERARGQLRYERRA